MKIVDKAREIFPVKTAAQLADITGYPLRTVEYWLTGNSKIPTDAFVALLHSDHGREFLAGVMTDATPRWWLQLKAFFGAIDLAVAQRIHRRKMKALLDADFASQIPHAALFQDEEFYSAQPQPHHEAYRPLVRRKAGPAET
ncbi:MAG TPA: hypothetical protein VGH13_11605 [Xanthobacteraceae bacterium]